MSLKRRKQKITPEVETDFNKTSERNPAHNVDENTNFAPRPIKYEDTDQILYKRFDNWLYIRNQLIRPIKLDAPIQSQHAQNELQYDSLKDYIKLPTMTLWRTGKAGEMRSSPHAKPHVYSIPKKKADGIVYEEWIQPVPRREVLYYELKFFSTYRENINIYEEKIDDLFRNKRIYLKFDTGDLFEAGPQDYEEKTDVDVIESEATDQQTIYVANTPLWVWGYYRDEVQKRERPNNIVLSIEEKSGPKMDKVDVSVDRLKRFK